MSKFVSFSYFALLSFNAVYSIQLYIAVHYATSTTPLVSSWLVRPHASTPFVIMSQGAHKGGYLRTHCTSILYLAVVSGFFFVRTNLID